jgi:hypothetical protein
LSSTKKNIKITWFNVLFIFVTAFAIPVIFIYFAVQGIDSGYFGGRPGYVSGSGILVWLVERLHIMIIGSFFGFFAFLSILILKTHQLIKGR